MMRRNRDSLEASKKALDAAREGLKQTQERGAEVTKVVNSIKLIREHNHFADQLLALFGGPRDARH